MDRVIKIEVAIYFASYLLAFIFLNKADSKVSSVGGYAGIGEGLAHVYMLLIFFLIGVAITAVNYFLIKRVRHQWTKYLAFTPILFSIVHGLIVGLELDGPREPGIDQQRHRLVVEFRTNKELHGVSLSFRSSNGSFGCALESPNRLEGSYQIYRVNLAIHYESDRYITLHSRSLSTDSSFDWETSRYYLNIDYKPKPAPFTAWKRLDDIQTNGETFQSEFRYAIER